MQLGPRLARCPNWPGWCCWPSEAGAIGSLRSSVSFKLLTVVWGWRDPVTAQLDLQRPGWPDVAAGQAGGAGQVCIAGRAGQAGRSGEVGRAGQAGQASLV